MVMYKNQAQLIAIRCAFWSWYRLWFKDICLLGTCQQWLTAAINVVQPPIRKYLQDYFKVSYLIIKFTPIIPDWRKYRYQSNIRKFCQSRSIQGSSQSSSCVCILFYSKRFLVQSQFSNMNRQSKNSSDGVTYLSKQDPRPALFITWCYLFWPPFAWCWRHF